MHFSKAWLSTATVLIVLTGASAAQELKEEPLCVENSPERSGEIGCSVVVQKSLPPLKEPIYWHIDRFDSEERARGIAGPATFSFGAHGSWWVMSIEPQGNDHHGGEHIAWIKLSPLPKADRYAIRLISAYIPANMTSRVHFHSGVEAFYTVEGEQCLETPTKAVHMNKGESFVISTGVAMRLVATGKQARRDFAVVVFDASKPPTTRLPMAKASELVSCTGKQP